MRIKNENFETYYFVGVSEILKGGLSLVLKLLNVSSSTVMTPGACVLQGSVLMLKSFAVTSFLTYLYQRFLRGQFKTVLN
jgi:hypothetical protein